MTKEQIKKQIAELQKQLEGLEECPLKEGRKVFYIDIDGDVMGDTFRNSTMQQGMLTQGNVFLTKEHAELKAKIDRFKVKVRTNFVPDWANADEIKYYFYFSGQMRQLIAERTRVGFVPSVIYYETQEELETHKAAYEEHYQDLIKLQRLDAERGF